MEFLFQTFVTFSAYLNFKKRNCVWYWTNLNILRENSKLESVNITNCDKLTQLEAKIFSALPFLKSLNFHRSGLTSISEDAADWDSVEFFDFSQ